MELVQVVVKDKDQVAKTPAVWAAHWQRALSVYVFVHNAGTQNPTNGVFLVSSTNARSAAPL